jgi:hypothetical protein
MAARYIGYIFKHCIRYPWLRNLTYGWIRYLAKFNKASKERLLSCNTKLIRLFSEVVKHFDCTVIDGFRDKLRQNKYYEEGASQVKFPYSKHNRYPSRAIDVAPYPIDWKDHKRFIYFAGFVKGIASQLEIKIVYGGDWDNDWFTSDNKFNDLVHFELGEGE